MTFFVTFYSPAPTKFNWQSLITSSKISQKSSIFFVQILLIIFQFQICLRSLQFLPLDEFSIEEFKVWLNWSIKLFLITNFNHRLEIHKYDKPHSFNNHIKYGIDFRLCEHHCHNWKKSEYSKSYCYFLYFGTYYKLRNTFSH